MLLAEKVGIVTGGAKGIGRAIATLFAKEGCSVVIADIEVDKGEEVASIIREQGGLAVYVHCDVTKFSDVSKAVDFTVSKFEKVDILVNNAGGIFGPEGNIEEITEEMWDRVVNLNLKSQFLCCKAVVPHMKRRRYGKIINISSMGALFPPLPVIHYAAAKAGVLGLTTNLAQELAVYNINVNAILPGPIRTSFHEPVLGKMEEKERELFYQRIAKTEVPLRRVGMPEDIAGVALFLASELSSYLTGAFIFAGGGLPLAVWPHE
ncbi:MAG: SDR family NAD(P)-dependent oxidoreductase [candidate division WOR-3 bacterium]